jgi:mono/diheme cytochrome c family protein
VERRRRWWGLLLVLSLLVAACAGTEASTAPETAEQIESVGDPDRGRDIWGTGGDVLYGSGCSQCHSIDGTEQTEIARKTAPSWLGISERAGSRVPGMSGEEYLRESILDPAAYIVEGYKNEMSDSLKYKLNDEDVNSLIAFMLTL